MAHPIQIILTRQLAAYLSVPLFLVDPKGNLLFYNEPAEAILGRRFDPTFPICGRPPPCKVFCSALIRSLASICPACLCART